ncbi:hypothetical protein P170DRAFT_434218 [Aspergillus steynii IBT 23096]|uniref:F-box domain-containing protein n=1 Tax=Aspergillus steynii IBT 23096 TaxID=1392250 RepID=A0A2I2GHU2_9EURO|nr:uncharacterized protein P170DRAFT_434218 [Aspergillus steynii IBT 23096]PLB52451.1 hypothetical protein P170DRAFT_434218 [Aspergillus steynii IBT 23096]
MTSLYQPSMATMLPVEIIQAILLHMDVETYLAARLTCKSWRNAASSSLMTHKTVQQIPVALPPTIRELDEDEWSIYLDQIAQINLLGFRNHVERTVSCRQRTLDYIAPATTRQAYPGRTSAGLKGSRTYVDENDIKQQLLQFPLASSLYPLWTSVCRALSDGCHDRWMAKHQPNMQPHLALSSEGRILAIGFGKRIQMFSALSGRQTEETSPVEYVINDNTHGIIESLEFEDDDKLLRLVIDKQPSRVRYLGLPSHASEKADMIYWRKYIGNTYLDSIELARSLSRSSTTRLVLAGLRLFPLPEEPGSVVDRRSEERRYFTACLQTGHVDCYCMGYISFYQPAHIGSVESVNIHRFLPSKQFQPYTAKPQSRSSKPQLSTLPAHALPQATLNPDNNYNYSTYSRQNDYHLTNIPRWDPINLPAASCDTPQLAISDDNALLVVYEPCTLPKGQGGSVYVYSVEACAPVYQPFPRTKAQRLVDWSIFGQDFGGLGLCFVFSTAFDMIKSKMTDVIPSWPFLLDRVDVDITSLKVVCDPQKYPNDSYVVTAKSAEGDIEWRLTRN